MTPSNATLNDLKNIPIGEIDAFITVFATGNYPKYWLQKNAYSKKYPPKSNTYQSKF